MSLPVKSGMRGPFHLGHHEAGGGGNRAVGGTSNDMRSARVGGSPGQIRRKAEGAIARSANQTQILLGTVLPLVRTHGTRASKTNCAGVCVLLNTETEIRLMRRARKTRTQIDGHFRHESDLVEIHATAQVKRTLAKPIELDGHPYSLEPRIGIAMFPRDGHEPETLIDNARAAILTAQSENRIDTLIAPSDSGLMPIVARQDLERELRWAIKHEQFVLQYAPVVELDGRRTVALDAQLLWMHPVCGIIPRAQFLPTLTALDARASLDRWALRSACRELSLLTQRGNTRIGLMLPLSRQALDSGDIAEEVSATADTNGPSTSRSFSWSVSKSWSRGSVFATNCAP